MLPPERRNRPPRVERVRGLVVTEGTETEKQYVERLSQHLRGSAAMVSVRTVGVGKDPRSVVKKCIELKRGAESTRKAYDWCVCLIDVDRHTTLSEARRLASDAGVVLLATNIKFEVWLLWHAHDVRSPQTSAQLDRLMMRNDLLVGKHLSARFPIDRFEDAISLAVRVDPDYRAGRIGPDPSSALPLLVSLMRGTPE